MVKIIVLIVIIIFVIFAFAAGIWANNMEKSIRDD